MPYVSGCQRSGTANGPVPHTGEKTPAAGAFGGRSAVFGGVRHAGRPGQDVGAERRRPDIHPGVAEADIKRRGNYMEYAYAISEQKQTPDRERKLVGMSRRRYVLAYSTDDVGGSRSPIRDIRSRYAPPVS